MDLILTYHVEGERDTPSAAVYAEIERQVLLADQLGYHAAWFAEHHFHIHRGHLPNPLLFVIHLAAKTRRIRLGSAVICTALHHPLRLAEDLATADVLTGGRLSIGLGSGSTPPEFAAFGVPPEAQMASARHARFAEHLDVLEQVWRGGPIAVCGRSVQIEAPPVLPRPASALQDVLWIAANSLAQAEVAGERGYGVMLSRERTPEEMLDLVEHYRAGRRRAGLAGPGRVAASRAVFVGPSAAAAQAAAAKAVYALVERQRATRPQFAALPPPVSFAEACERVQFVAGGPEVVARAIGDLRRRVPFSAFHLQPRWQGLAPSDVETSIACFLREVAPQLGG
jgi:alkanesulfonate monooxygenase SsuD/methylene tetrahydromethanopterin reductase-like flavin-dependent oxidoreductase (luciferase family)